MSGKTVTIGAGTTHADVAADEKLKKAGPPSPTSPAISATRMCATRGTIGGSIANNDPAADYPAALLALSATIVTNKREIAADKFFKGLFETALKDDEIVTAVSFTPPAKAGYAKFPNPASRYAITGVFVAKGKDGVRVAVTGAGENGVFRAKEIEAALPKKFDAVGARRHQGFGREPDGRHPRLAGIPRQSDRGDGQARRGASQRVGAKIPPCLPRQRRKGDPDAEARLVVRQRRHRCAGRRWCRTWPRLFASARPCGSIGPTRSGSGVSCPDGRCLKAPAPRRASALRKASSKLTPLTRQA